MNKKSFYLLLIFHLIANVLPAQLATKKQGFTLADTLRGTITAYRAGWDVIHYDLEVEPDIVTKSISGKNVITYRVLSAFDTMQIDLQQSMVIDSITDEDHHTYSYVHMGNLYLVKVDNSTALAKDQTVKKLAIYFHGIPKEAKNAPWDGGLVWRNDEQGNPWVATACQGLGASVWWPCKDHQSDEPDSGMIIKLIAPDTLSAISNGRLKNVGNMAGGKKMWTWQVTNPINNYDVTMNIGKYTSWNDTLMGEAGKLDLQFWVLKYNLQKAKTQFVQAKQMLRAFEYWFGKYPFYSDSYKLVDAPFLGMEHQSAVAYGNRYQNGYLGNDLSGTGWGLKWDFIIVHESGHEWFGNNITTKDVADMWVHEGFTNYSESLFTEYEFGKAAGNEYCYGTRKKIRNEKPIIGLYGVNSEGSGDMYYKGGNMINLIRHSINNDALFREILHGLNSTFYHSTVTTKQVEDYISQTSNMDFSKVFDQYLRTTQIPQLEYYFTGKKLFYRWTNCVPGFNLSIVLGSDNKQVRLAPTTEWQSATFSKKLKALWSPAAIDMNYYISIKK